MKTRYDFQQKTNNFFDINIFLNMSEETKNRNISKEFNKIKLLKDFSLDFIFVIKISKIIKNKSSLFKSLNKSKDIFIKRLSFEFEYVEIVFSQQFHNLGLFQKKLWSILQQQYKIIGGEKKNKIEKQNEISLEYKDEDVNKLIII